MTKPRQFTQEEKNAIDDLAARFAEGSHDLMSLSYSLQREINLRLHIIDMRREKEARKAMAKSEPGLWPHAPEQGL